MERAGRRPTRPGFLASTQYKSNKIVDRGFCQDTTTHGQAMIIDTTLRPKKQRLSSQPPEHDGDSYSDWTPFHDDADIITSAATDSPEDAATSFSPDENARMEEGPPPLDDDELRSGSKRKRYVSSDDPNAAWRIHAVNILHELFRFDGLGDFLPAPCCSSCGTTYPEDSEGRRVRLFRCLDCNVLLQCLDCCLDNHKLQPLHNVKEYDGGFFRKTWLADIGLEYQLGHGGLCCAHPDTLLRTLTVLHTNGIHNVRYRYCDCATSSQPTHAQQILRNGWYPATITEPRSCATFQVMDMFRNLNVIANINTNDFVDVLERLTSFENAESLPDRYTVFGRMNRQWSFLFRVKRSGVGMELKSLDDVLPGSLANKCWACPWDGINLPANWRTVDPKDSYLYMPVLALDANFRLKNRLRPNERPDLSIAPGSAYFVDPQPYKEFISKYVSEKDISTCIAFAALLLKDTKLTTGLRTSGVGGCACARHEIVRPMGMGDLQKGERQVSFLDTLQELPLTSRNRYVNMDFVFFSAIQGLGLPRIAVSYDIVCQWRVNLLERMTRLPPHLQLQKSSVKFTFGLPTWHASVHETSCKTSNSLTYQEGVGRTDGEGIERIWSVLNPSSYATKGMGEGNRHDTLDDRIDYHNIKKNLGQGVILARRLKLALEQRDIQIVAFNDADAGLDPVKRATWMKIFTDWKEDSDNPSPFMIPESSNAPTESQVRKELEQVEEKESQEGRNPVYGTTALAFVAMGLQLEDIQVLMQKDTKINRRTAVQEMRLRQHQDTFTEMLERFRNLQEIYMPGASRAMHTEEKDRRPESAPIPIEETRLWLPSDLAAAERRTGCVAKVVDIEIRLRSARCADAISSLRHHLHGKQYLIAFRNANVTGQKESTKACGLIESIGARVETEAAKYRRSRKALLALGGTSMSTLHPELLSSHITLDTDIDPDLVAAMKLGNIGNARRHRHVSTGKKVISWIWTAYGGANEDDLGYDVARVEWSKAMARRDRWIEEVNRLRAEMKAVLRFLDWEIDRWTQMTPTVPQEHLHHPDSAVKDGMRAYAYRQVAVYTEVARRFRQLWRVK